MLVAGWLRDKKGQDVIVLDVTGICPITEMLVLASATSPRHAKGLASHVLDMAAEQKLEYLGMEGQAEGAWILVDLNDVLVHVFSGDNRELFDLEGLWCEGARVGLPDDATA
ncbi:ribosome silencing factor [Desulfovibrio sp. X2]|uniref:ribosome silencing factor n=1 Tax=Desulfovibrio sp. X2 TaxID=941449 RepID=UPI001F030515|nr:ribosome silencing factor [Desulfovibrio sp. X2]